MDGIPLEPIQIELHDPIFNAIANWPFEEDFVCRILTEDIPQRVKYEAARIWAYRDSQKTIVGFGTLSLCMDYPAFSNDMLHMYIPLIGVHPEKRSVGHGRSIVNHLVEEAGCFVDSVTKNPQARISDFVFLDVYEESVLPETSTSNVGS
jgi:ribosomal protein S18 acetylase RimI-like enzyme